MGPMSGPATVACKNCRNPCRLVLSGILTVDPMNRLESYNLWQCDECGALFRELAGDKRIIRNHVCDA